MSKFKVGDIVSSVETVGCNLYKILVIRDTTCDLQLVTLNGKELTDATGDIFINIDMDILRFVSSSLPTLSISKATVLLGNGTDLIILTTNLPSPMPCIDSSPAKLELRTQKDCGIDYVRKNFGIEPEVLNDRRV